MASKPPALSVSPTHLVATLFYKSDAPHFFPHADLSPRSPDIQLPSASLESLRDGAAPTENLADYPLEPPTPGPSALDNLYGSYISQSCLTDFFVTLTNIIPGLQQTSIASRKLENSAQCRVAEITFPLPATSTVTLETLRRNDAISRFEREWNVECVVQVDNVYRRHKRLAVFDMDSTLIQQEVIDEIAALIGVQDKVSAITAQAMNGELDFEASLRARCKLLKGVPATVFETLRSRITLNEGVKDLITVLKRLGYKTAVLSGGFTPLTSWLAGELGLDYCFANHLVVSSDNATFVSPDDATLVSPDGDTLVPPNGATLVSPDGDTLVVSSSAATPAPPVGAILTGELTGDIVHAERKAQHLAAIAEKEDILLEQVIAIGDGANDLPMMGCAGLGVAFHAKPKVQMQAPARLNSKSMLDVLYLFGFTREEQDMLLLK